MSASSKEFLTEKRINIIFSVFKYFYIISAAFLLLAALTYVLVGRGTTALGIVPSAAVASVIAYGIYKRRSWVVIVITLLAAFGIASNALRLPSETITSLIFIVILVFEIYFFNRKDVKAKLGAKGKTLF